MSGNVGYFEVRVDDIERAQKFYHEVFGWEFIKSPLPFEYYMVNNPTKGPMGIFQGGMRKRENPLAKDHGVSGFVCLVLVDNMDQAVEKVKQHGGHITDEKMHIPAGWFAYALDSEGNAFGMWEMEAK